MPGSTTASVALDTHVRLLGVRKAFPGQAHPVLDDIQLEVLHGEVFGIIGRSGAGKSTLLRTINGLARVDEGQLFVDQLDVRRCDAQQLVELRRRVGMVFQHFNLMAQKTVAANVGLPLKVAGVARDIRRRKVDELLQLVGLHDKQHLYPAQLSGGQKQRVGIARALVHEPQVLLCDEATSALDPETTEAILQLLREINRKLCMTTLLITHEMSVIRSLCDRVAVLDKGRIVELGTVDTVFKSPQHAVTRSLLATQGIGTGRLPEEGAGPCQLKSDVHPKSRV